MDPSKAPDVSQLENNFQQLNITHCYQPSYYETSASNNYKKEIVPIFHVNKAMMVDMFNPEFATYFSGM